MVSDFQVAHPSSPFFSLDENEMEECIKKYPNIEDFSFRMLTLLEEARKHFIKIELNKKLIKRS